MPIGYHKSAAVRAAAERLYDELGDAGIDVLLDDRDERPGVLFADMELIGIPHRLVLCERGLAAGNAEYKGRRDAKPRDLPLKEVVDFLKRSMRGLVAVGGRCSSPLWGARGNTRYYEPLADSVRQRLSRHGVGPAAPARLHFRSPEDGQRWIDEMEKRLAPRMPDRQSRAWSCCVRCTTRRCGRGSIRSSCWGVIEVESGFRKYAVSRAGARGYMQVMPFWVKLIGQPNHNLFHLRTNLAYGCAILRHYLDMERGDYFRALGRYNGSPRAGPSTRTWCSRRGGPLEVRRAHGMSAAGHDRRPARAQSAPRQLALRLHAARARHHRAGAPARVHRARRSSAGSSR